MTCSEILTGKWPCDGIGEESESVKMIKGRRRPE